MSATWLTHLEHQWRSLAWRPWLDVFTREHKVLRHDSRGCGLSDRNVGDLSFETWVRDLECVVDAAGFRRFAIVGTCWGGPIAVEYAVRHPERVSHLVLYGTYARGRMRRTDTPAEAKRGSILGDLTRLGWGQENHAFVQIWSSLFQPGGTPEHSRSWCDQMRAATSAETAIRLFQIASRTDVRDVAPKVRCPALIVHSERDMVAPIEEGRLLASLIPDSRFVQLDSENHMLLADEPAWQQLVAEVRRFLAEPSSAVVAGGKSLSLGELTPRERAVLERHRQGTRQRGDRRISSAFGENGPQSHYQDLRQDSGQAPLSGHRHGPRSGARRRCESAGRRRGRTFVPRARANPNSAPGHRPQYSGPRSPHDIVTACTRHAGTQVTVKRNRVKRAVE